MLRKLLLCLSLVCLSGPILAADQSASKDDPDDDSSLEPLSESDKESALEFTQKEQQNKFKTGLGLSLGWVMPWSKFGAAFLTKSGNDINSLSLAVDQYQFSGNIYQRNYVVEGTAESAFIARRFFVLGFGPLYLEPAIGVVHWNGEVKPRGSDDLEDVLASSLNSRFDMLGADVSVNFGLMWIFSHGIFLDYNFMGLSHAIMLQETYTVSTHEARRAVRSQIGGLISMSSVNLRLGYAFDF